MSTLAHREGRTLFERAWAHGVGSGIIGEAEKAEILREGVKAMRRLANLLGSENLRADLERAMRAMLGLVNLHLQRESHGDPRVASRLLAEYGLLYHTRGASQSIKRILAEREGLDFDRLDPSQTKRFDFDVVASWANMSFDEFMAQEREAQVERERRAAARSLSRLLEGAGPAVEEGAERVVMTAVLVLAYTPRKKVWPKSQSEFEKLLEAVRKAPAKLKKLPKSVPEELVPVVGAIWDVYAPKVKALVCDSETPLHVLAGGDPSVNRLHDLVALPDDALGELEDMEAQTTSHWKQLTGGKTDEERLLAVMLQGVFGFEAKWPIGVKAAVKLLREVVVERPEDRVVRGWLDANAPHQFHEGLVEIWEAFWDERELVDADASDATVRELAAAWIPMKSAKAE